MGTNAWAHRVEHVMGMAISMDVAGPSPAAALAEAVAWFHHVDAVFSPYRETSIITRIGRGEIDIDHPALGGDIDDVLQRCEELRVMTDGVFDVWAVPAPNGTNFDPCGFVKGWAVDRAVQQLTQHGIEDMCINAGGDVALRGTNRKGQDWTVGIRHPGDPHALATRVRGRGPLAIATSGTYERGAHIVDPRLGHAVTDLASATVIGSTTCLADVDAFATTLFVMGVEGLQWLAANTECGGYVITHDGHTYSTPEFDRLRAA